MPELSSGLTQLVNEPYRNIVGRARLANLLRRVATRWVLLAQVWIWSNLSQQHPTCPATQRNRVAKRAQQCYVDMLRSFGLKGFLLKSNGPSWNSKFLFKRAEFSKSFPCSSLICCCCFYTGHKNHVLKPWIRFPSGTVITPLIQVCENRIYSFDIPEMFLPMSQCY